MTRTILLYGAFTALLIVALRYFELSLFAGAVSTKLYVTAIGALFLLLGVLAGIKLRKRNMEKEIVVQYVEKRVEVEVPAPAPAGEPVELIGNDLLSPRESEVLLHIAKGLSNREIAEQLFVSENTIKTHINNIYAKLGVRRRTQAVSKAKEMKILR